MEIDPFCGDFNLATNQPAGTMRMVARLREIQRTSNPLDNIYQNDSLVDHWRLVKALATNAQDVLRARVEYAVQLMRAGETAESLQEFAELHTHFEANQIQIPARVQVSLRMQQALAWLRLGEQENCLMNHTTESCLLPIQGEGVHKLEKGSRQAIELLTQQLQEFPADLAARWLLNIAHMTVGDYPAKVPVAWRIPPQVFASEYELPRFTDVAGGVGVDVDDLAGACIAEDFDGDGLLDILASSWSLRGQLRYFRNNGDGTFSDRTAAAGLLGLTGGLNMMQTDYNNDGRPDVFMLRGGWLGQAGRHPKSLLRNNGNGTFEDVTEEAGLLSPNPTQTATWLDFDGDGWIDVFIGHESYGQQKFPCELYRNNGDGTFTECAAASGVAAFGLVKGVTSGDFNNDGRPDIYLSCREEFNVLLRNDGPAPGHSAKNPAWQFSDVTDTAGVKEPRISFPTWFFDYDNDGWQDIFVAGYNATVADVAADYLRQPHRAERARLFRNKGDGTFADVTVSVGLYRVMLAMGSNFGDLDNDGWLDFYLGTGDPEFFTLVPNRAFRNNGGRNFQEVTTSAGLGHLQKGHAIAFADFDLDGDQDIYAVMGGAYSGDNYRNALFANPGNSNRWITLKLEGTRSNRAAIGARICVQVAAPGGSRSIYKTVSSGGSFGASPLRQEIGLGDATAIQKVEIFWPATGKTQVIAGLQLNAFYRIREDSDRAVRQPMKSFQLATGKAPHHSPGKSAAVPR